MTIQNVMLLLSLTFPFIVCTPALAEVVTIEVTIKSLDSDTRVLVVTKALASKTKDIELEVGKGAKVTIGGKEGTLESVKPGQKATIAYESALEVVTKIEISDNTPLGDKPKSEAIAGDDLKLLQGTWIAVAEESAGKRMKKEDVTKMRKTLTVTEDDFSLIWSGKSMQGKCKLISSDAPSAFKAIDLDGALPTGTQAVLKGIYELKGDTLRMCYAVNIVAGQKFERPTSFETQEGLKGVSVTYQRKK